MEIEQIQPGTIVVAIDGSEHAERALMWAAHQATLEGGLLTIVHIVDDRDVRLAGWGRLDEAPHYTGAAWTEGATMVKRAVALVEAALPGLKTATLTAVGDPRTRLVELSATAHLLVLGSRGRGTFRSLVLGSVSSTTAMHAKCPVVVTRPEGDAVHQHGVLVGADGSPESREVLTFAFEQASLRGVPLTVMHASFYVAFDPPSPDGDSPELRLLLAQSVAGLAEDFPDVTVDLQLAAGLVDECLTRDPHVRDLIVVGRHPVRSLSRLLAGSVASAVLERAHSPVAVVPDRDSQAGAD